MKEIKKKKKSVLNVARPLWFVCVFLGKHVAFLEPDRHNSAVMLSDRVAPAVELISNLFRVPAMIKAGVNAF